MAYPIDTGEVISSLLLVKAVLAVLAVLIFVYYKINWERAKKHLQVHFFFTRWRTARHAAFLGAASFGFALGFAIELLGPQLGFSPNHARFYSSVFEIGSLLAMLYVFFTLALEDVPHFQHVAEAARHHAHHQPNHEEQAAAPQKKLPRKKRKGRKRK